MKRRYIIKRAGRSLRQAKARTLLTSLAIAVGAFTLTLSIAAGEGSRQYAEKLIKSNINPQAILVFKDKALIGEGGFNTGLKEYSENTAEYSGLDIKPLSAKDLEKVSRDKDIEKVVPSYLVEAQYVQFEGNNKKYTSDITVYDSSVLAEATAGTLPPLGKQIQDHEIVVPEKYLETLKVKKPSQIVGKKVTLHLVRQVKPTEEQVQEAMGSGGLEAVEKLLAGEVRDVEFRVSAVSKDSVTSLSASNGLFISENKAKELSNFLTEGTPQHQNYFGATVVVKKGVDPEVVADRFSRQGIEARTAEDLQSLLFTIVNLLQGIVAGFGVLALIASIFGIINTQYISVLERVQQIGLMKALGMRNRDVAKLFRYEAAWIGFLGGVIGSVLACTIGTLLNPWITETLSLGEGNFLLVFQPLPIIGLVAGLMIIAVIAGYFPARKAAKLDPIEALRTE